jgi:hypothetical protein
MDVFEIYEQAMANGELSCRDLLRLEEFCNEKSSMLRDWAASVVGSLSDICPAAADLVVKLVKNGRADIAISAVAALHDLDNNSLRLRVVSCGLKHRSKNVRELAACKAQRFQLYPLLGELEDAIAAGTDENHRKNLNFSFALLRDGHLVEHLESGAVYVTVASSRSLVGRTFSKESVKEKGLQQIIEELKSSAKF